MSPLYRRNDAQHTRLVFVVTCEFLAGGDGVNRSVDRRIYLGRFGVYAQKGRGGMMELAKQARDWQQIWQQIALEQAGMPEANQSLLHATRYGQLAGEIERLKAELDHADTSLIEGAILNNDLRKERDAAITVLRRIINCVPFSHQHHKLFQEASDLLSAAPEHGGQ